MNRPASTLADAARIVREAEAVRDKSYRKYLLGQEWGRFLRAKRLAGCAPNTLLSYETVGRVFALRHADLQSLEPFALHLRHQEPDAAQVGGNHRGVSAPRVDDLRHSIEQLSTSDPDEKA